MNGIHDMGGMHGMGPMEIEPDEPVFHEPWEGRVLAFNWVLAPWGRGRDWGGFRFSQEVIPAQDYLRMSYYERWFTVFENRALNSGLVTRQELDSGHADANLAVPELLPNSSLSTSETGLPDNNITAAFKVDQQIHVKELNPPGHIRLPRYTRDKPGTIVRDNGVFMLQDTDINGQLPGNYPQHVYTVRFTAFDLWGVSGHKNDAVYADLWESYLESA